MGIDVTIEQSNGHWCNHWTNPRPQEKQHDVLLYMCVCVCVCVCDGESSLEVTIWLFLFHCPQNAVTENRVRQ